MKPEKTITKTADPWRALAAAVLLQAVADALSGDAAAAHWLDGAGRLFCEFLELPDITPAMLEALARRYSTPIDARRAIARRLEKLANGHQTRF